MNPQELQDWIARHGGLDRSDRSMVGQMIFLARDGSRVVLTQLTPDSYQIDDITEKDADGNVTTTAPPAQSSAPAAVASSEASGPVASASIPSPGRGGVTSISKADLEAKAASNPNLSYQGQKIIDKQVSEYGVTKTIRVPVVTWIDKRTGYTLSAEVGAGGDTYVVTQDGIDEKNKSDDQSRNPTQIASDEKAKRDQAEREKNAALPPDQDPAYETDDERRKRADARIKEQGQAAKDEEARAERAAAQARATRASELSALKPGTTISTIGGQKYTTIVTPSTTPGGQPTITHLGPDNKPIAALPPEPPESTSTTITRNGRTFIQTTTKRQDGTSGVTFTDTAGNPVAELPREGATELPPGMPELDTSTPDTARASYLAQVKWAQEQVRAGRMTRQEAVELTTPSHQAAETVISGAQQSIENARATRGQDISQEGNRLNATTSQYANAQRAVDDVWKVAPRGGTQAGDVLLGSILMQQLLNRQTQGSAGPVAAPGVVTTPPLTAPAAAITPPNAIGAGAVPGAITPTGVASIDAAAKAASASPEIPMTPERVQGIMQNPVFRPSPEAVMPAAAPDPDAVSVEQMPASIRRAYGRTIIDGILQQYGVAS